MTVDFSRLIFKNSQLKAIVNTVRGIKIWKNNNNYLQFLYGGPSEAIPRWILNADSINDRPKKAQIAKNGRNRLKT